MLSAASASTSYSPYGHAPSTTATPLSSSSSTSSSSSSPDPVVSSAPVKVDPDQMKPEEPEIDIVINNVVCSFSVQCHLNLRDIALRGINVEYRRENGMVTMKLRRPYTTASMWSSGKVTCTGANSEDQAKVAARRYCRVLQKLGFKIRFRNFRVVNVLGTCTLPFAIKITQFSQRHRERASYEPELHPGVTYKIKDPKATLKIFSTGSVTITAPSVKNVQSAVEHIYGLVEEFKKPKTIADLTKPIPEAANKKRKKKLGSSSSKKIKVEAPGSDDSDASDDSD